MQEKLIARAKELLENIYATMNEQILKITQK